MPAVALPKFLSVAFNLLVGISHAEVVLGTGRELPEPQISWPNRVLKMIRWLMNHAYAALKESKPRAFGSSCRIEFIGPVEALPQKRSSLALELMVHAAQAMIPANLTFAAMSQWPRTDRADGQVARR